jgi:DNA-binding response OmpR family regulator
MSMRILIVEDNKAFASLIAARLDKSGIESDQAESLEQAERSLSALEYAAIILDLGLSDGDGLDLLRGLRARGDSTPVVITSARHSLEDRVRGLREGADDYLAKPFSVDELIARLQAVMRRPSRLVGQTLRAGNISLDTQNRQVNIDQRVHIIRRREILILELLMRHVGTVVRRKFFVDQLFGIEGERDSNTVDVYVHRLRRQLLDGKATVTIHTIRGVGYMMTEAHTPISDHHGEECNA